MADIPRYLAGAGAPEAALAVLKAAEWRLETDREGNCVAFSPDGLVIAAFTPERNSFVRRGTSWPPWEPLWTVRAYTTPDRMQTVWEATFTSSTPVEFIAAFLADLVRPDALDTDRDIAEPTGTN